MKNIILGFLFIFLGWVVSAQTENSSLMTVQVSVEEASVFSEPHFEAEVSEMLPYGKTLSVVKVKGSDFFKFKKADGTFGYVTQGEVEISSRAQTQNQPGPFKEEITDKKSVKKKTTQRKTKAFDSQRFIGLAYENQNYTENTLGKNRTESTGFYGVKISGNNTLYDGEVYTDSLFLINSAAPSWYKTVSQGQVSGFILNSHFLFENAYPHSQDVLVYWGFGPMFQLSHYDIVVFNSSTGKNNNYSMDDASIGAVFNVGVALRILPKANLRFDGKYYWHKTQYYALGAALQFAF